MINPPADQRLAADRPTGDGAPGRADTATAIEYRTVDRIPETERHGRMRDLFTIWFGSNLMLLTVATGALATAVYGLPLAPALFALLIGNVVGGVVMALHAAQGPTMGVPQMLQSKAQFGALGSLIVVLLVLPIYSGFFASNLVLSGGSLSYVIPAIGPDAGIVIMTVLSLIVVVVGYRLIHSFSRVMTVLSGAALLLAFVWIFAVHPLPAGALSGGAFSWVGFMSTVSLAALWQIAYAPYVSDYTRYMPVDTGTKPAFWGTYLGCVLGSFLPMVLGMFLGLAFPTLDTVSAVAQATAGIAAPILVALGIGIACTNAMNLYCGSLAMLTAGNTMWTTWRPRAGSRIAAAIVLGGFSCFLAIAGKDDFLANYSNFLLLLMCILIPWTAVNLVDYYAIRHGNYDIASLFAADGGVYGRVNSKAVICYVIGILVQLPFLSNALYTGPVAKAMQGVDISWIVGLAVICPLYYVMARRDTVRSH
jgi:purine-cytosine permease-like protein